MSTIANHLSEWELFSKTLEAENPGLPAIQRKIENLMLILARLEGSE